MVSMSLLSKSSIRVAKLIWYYDPCSESSICKFRDMFDISTYRSVNDPNDCIISGDGMKSKVVGRGDVVLRFRSGFKIRLKDVAHVPKYIANVFKPQNTHDFHFIEKFDKVHMQIVAENYREVLIGTYKSRKIYELDLEDSQLSLISAEHDKSQCSESHSQSGHQNDQVMTKAATDGHQCQNANCSICKKQNLRRDIPKNRFNKSVHPLHSVHVDIIVKSGGFGGIENVLTIVDDYSGCYFAYSFEEFCKKNPVWHQMTPRSCSFKNGKVERANQTIQRIANKMLEDCDLSNSIWAKAFEMAAVRHNHTPNNTIGGKWSWSKFTDYVDRRKDIKFGARVYYLDPTVH